MVPAREVQPGDLICNFGWEHEDSMARLWVMVADVLHVPRQDIVRIATGLFIREEHPTQPIVVRRRL